MQWSVSENNELGAGILIRTLHRVERSRGEPKVGDTVKVGEYIELTLSSHTLTAYHDFAMVSPVSSDDLRGCFLNSSIRFFRSTARRLWTMGL